MHNTVELLHLFPSSRLHFCQTSVAGSSGYNSGYFVGLNFYIASSKRHSLTSYVTLPLYPILFYQGFINILCHFTTIWKLLLCCLNIDNKYSYLLNNWASLVAQTVKSLPAMWETQVQSLGRADPLEKEMAAHPSILAWKISWMVEPGRLQSMRLQRVGQDWATSLSLTE